MMASWERGRPARTMMASWERGRPARTKPGTASAISPTWINRERPHGCRLHEGLNAIRNF